MFRDRHEAGQILAEKLHEYCDRPDVLILALPRGGVPVAFEVAIALDAPLDVFVVRKLGVPWHRELAMGAIASGGVRVVNEDVVRSLGISDDIIDEVTEVELHELERREAAYRDGRPRPEIRGKVVILVDDGLATGSTMRAAVEAVLRLEPKRVVVAVPVGASDTCRELKEQADDVVCVQTPEPLFGVGSWYEDFSQTTDDEVRELLTEAHEASMRNEG
jgi:predicted phosphoribosyltransferase